MDTHDYTQILLRLTQKHSLEAVDAITNLLKRTQRPVEILLVQIHINCNTLYTLYSNFWCYYIFIATNSIHFRNCLCYYTSFATHSTWDAVKPISHLLQHALHSPWFTADAVTYLLQHRLHSITASNAFTHLLQHTLQALQILSLLLECFLLIAAHLTYYGGVINGLNFFTRHYDAWFCSSWLLISVS